MAIAIRISTISIGLIGAISSLWRGFVGVDMYFGFASRQLRELYVREASVAQLIRASNILENAMTIGSISDVATRRVSCRLLLQAPTQANTGQIDRFAPIVALTEAERQCLLGAGLTERRTSNVSAPGRAVRIAARRSGSRVEADAVGSTGGEALERERRRARRARLGDLGRQPQMSQEALDPPRYLRSGRSTADAHHTAGSRAPRGRSSGASGLPSAHRPGVVDSPWRQTDSMRRRPPWPRRGC